MELTKTNLNWSRLLLDSQRTYEESSDAIVPDTFPDILRISARIYAPNIASRRVLEKNGFQQEGVMRRAVCKGEQVYDMHIFGRLREE